MEGWVDQVIFMEGQVDQVKFMEGWVEQVKFMEGWVEQVIFMDGRWIRLYSWRDRYKSSYSHGGMGISCIYKGWDIITFDDTNAQNLIKFFDQRYHGFIIN